MLIIKNNGLPTGAMQLARAILATGIVRGKSHHQITTELMYLVNGPELFGEVDLVNEQQVELAAYRVLKGVENPGPQPKPKEPDVYELVIIGAGTTTAYYLDTLGPAYDHSTTVVIGEENPWIRQRGHGISYVNHTWRQIAMPSWNVTEYGGNESFANRQEFGLQAEGVIARRVKRWEKTSARNIKKLETGVYQITYGSKALRTVQARRVVFAAGSGSVRTPPELTKKPLLRNVARIIDMNTFVRDKAVQEKGTRGTVVVWGSNAAIDAVAAAKVHGWTIGAWLYSQEGQPAWLPGTRYRSKPYELHLVNHHVYRDRRALKIEDSGSLLKVMDGQTLVADGVSYVVYGLGTEDLLTEGGPHKMMDDSVKEGQQTLKPILDTAGVFGNPNDSGRQTPAFLGWQNESGTFRVFGLSAENYAGPSGRVGPDDPRVMALKSWISGDVLTIGQLTYIRSALRAVNNYIPGAIEHAVDYSHADVNTLRVHLAARYPDLPEDYATWFISMLRRVRSDLQARLPHGFTREQTALIEQQLAIKERQIQRGGPNSRIDAVNWQWHFAYAIRDLTPLLGQEVETALAKLPLDKR